MDLINIKSANYRFLKVYRRKKIWHIVSSDNRQVLLTDFQQSSSDNFSFLFLIYPRFLPYPFAIQWVRWKNVSDLTSTFSWWRIYQKSKHECISQTKICTTYTNLNNYISKGDILSRFYKITILGVNTCTLDFLS